ncbi:tetratricopeptide repeat protein [Saccharothrix obliqua]|uniref:tetratricopeptide repeat protein n=1 Tax=Saccharothrix obliqua TaxID=2861747 RepID=UPI001C5D4B97|nr:tetratricopeptide repeat protein [Saccharothrix obliqua]MBW4717966.1 tetratricopeptide repeat protein [Saccharothrix obliqua]
MTGWQELNDEGVRLIQAGDVAGARVLLERARLVAEGEQRTPTLVNLAAAADVAGDGELALGLLTEALAVASPVTRVAVLAARAGVLAELGRADEAWQDTEAALGIARPHEEVLLRDVRAGLHLAAGRLAEAEAEARAAADLAHAPEQVALAHQRLAGIAEAAGDPVRAAEYRQARPVDHRWHRCVELNGRGAELAAAGDLAGARELFEAAHREVADEDDLDALVCRAVVAGNLAGVADAVRWSTEAIDVGRVVLARGGDPHGTTQVVVNALLTRAQHLRHGSRLDEALADLDEAAALVGEQPPVVALRAAVLAAAGRFAEASVAAGRALDLAYASAPELLPFVHSTLAEIAGGTGDHDGGVEHHSLARDLAEATGDGNARAAALVSLARLAYLASDHDRAAALYDEAEALLRTAGDERALAPCLLGRAAVETARGRPRAALPLVEQALAVFGDRVTPVELIVASQVHGAALEALGEYAAADERYAAAEEACERAGLWHVSLGAAWWRADALVRRAATVDGVRRQELARRALDVALPAALAAEAVRQRFPHGPLRERWVALAAAPAVQSAFTALAAVGDVDLAAAYIDHVAGTVSLSPAEEAPVERGDLVALPAPPVPEEDHLPYAASFLTTAGEDPAFPAAGFALPPRVRLDPATPTALDAWLDTAERRYGFPVRSAEAVASW